MSYPNRVSMDAIRTLAFGGIGGAYAAVGAALTAEARIFQITNLCNTSMLFSLDGVNDHFIVPANSFILIDVTANKVRDDGFFLRVGTIFWVKQVVAPASGSVYVTVIHS